MNELKAKLLSRKFWVTLLPLVAGIAQLFGADGELVELISGAILAIVPAVAYVVTEGALDRKKKNEEKSEK